MDQSDEYIHMKFSMKYGADEEIRRGYVRRRALNHKGDLVGRRNNNPMIDTPKYKV